MVAYDHKTVPVRSSATPLFRSPYPRLSLVVGEDVYQELVGEFVDEYCAIPETFQFQAFDVGRSAVFLHL